MTAGRALVSTTLQSDRLRWLPLGLMHICTSANCLYLDSSPARSTKRRQEVLTLMMPSSVHLRSKVQVKTQCERLESLLALVLAT